MAKFISLFLMMYLVTVVLFLVETGSLSTGLYYGAIAASLKTAVAYIHGHFWSFDIDNS